MAAPASMPRRVKLKLMESPPSYFVLWRKLDLAGTNLSTFLIEKVCMQLSFHNVALQDDGEG
jgi:hypothetical protein